MSAKIYQMDANHYAFHCPGCEGGHMVSVSGNHPVWGWNGSVDAPTFIPSIRVTGVQPLTDEEAERIYAGGKIEPRPLCCHSFVTDGRIQFLGDCTHSLAGQTVEIPDWDDA
jgi:hypothetical protein